MDSVSIQKTLFLEMTVEEENRELLSDSMIPPVTVPAQKKRTRNKLVKRLQKIKQPETHVHPISAIPSAVLKKLATKRAKTSSKFARKKYVCPHCNRRFLTRGNVKNHMRTHSRDKPFECPVCQVRVFTSIF